MSTALSTARTSATPTTATSPITARRTAAPTTTATTTPSPGTAPSAAPQNALGTTVVLDLSGLGATISDPEADLPVDSADLPRLARHAHAAKAAGISEVALSPAFHLRSDALWRADAELDAVRTGERLTDAGVDVLLPGAPEPTERPQTVGITASAAVRATRPTPQRTTAGARTTGRVPASAAATAAGRSSRARTAGAGTTVTTARRAPYVNSVPEGEAAGRAGGTVVVRAVHHERVAEFVDAVRRGAREAGTEVRVLVELHVAIAETRERALARAELVADIAAVEKRELPWSGSAAVIGCVEEVRSEARSFAALGDGLLLVPISVPADLSAILRDLV